MEGVGREEILDIPESSTEKTTQGMVESRNLDLENMKQF
jgi:hypothetical protein